MKKSGKKEDRTLKNVVVFIAIIMIVFMSIICIELITVILTNKINSDCIGKIRVPEKNNEAEYNTTGMKFEELIINEEETNIYEKCKNGCNININSYGITYKYILSYKDNKYILNVVKDKELLLSDKDLGSNLENAYFKMYLGYITFYNMINDGYYEYDYVTVVNNLGSLDEFSSLSNNELEFTDNGIVYYYDSCIKDNTRYNAIKVKAIRRPFNIEPEILRKENTNFDWCK